MAVRDIIQAAAGVGGADYQISRSLRFNSADSAYLSRTPASTSNRKTWTWSGWVKRGNIPNDTSQFTFLSAGANGGDTIMFSDGNKFTVNIGLLGLNAGVIPTQVQRDASAWYHFVAAIDTTQATAADRVKMYVNGVQITSFTTTNYPSQNQDATINSTTAHNIGRQTNSGNYLDGYLTEVNLIDGQALTPSDFGETDATTGVWKPKAYTGTYGTNGFYLNFSDNSGVTSTTLGKDQAGSNNWTPNNFSVTAGAGNDSLVDVPTRNTEDADTGAGGEVRGNYCTFNPLESTGTTLTNGNLEASYNTTNWVSAKGTISMTSGKWYFEATPLATWDFGIIGVFKTDVALPASGGSGFFTGSASGWGYQTRDDLSNNGVDAGGGSPASSGDTMMVAVDIDAGKLWFGLNGTWFSSGDPATGANAKFTNLSGAMSPAVTIYDNASGLAVNFGQRPFAYTAPSGFKALVTTNLPEPTVVQGDDYFNTVLYTGTGASQSITGVGFQPDFVWVKNRGAAYVHVLFDVVRGSSGGYFNKLVTSTTAGESLYAQGAFGAVTALNSDGFTVDSSNSDWNQTNASGSTYVAWNWKANGAGVSNTDGTISSTVSANTDAGFSIVTYTGNSSSNQTVGHGLGVTPSLIIVKCRGAGNTNWVVWSNQFASLTDNLLLLNTTSGTITFSNYWGTSAPTSVVFGVVGGGYDNNQNGLSHVAYCFAEVEGFSKFGSYTGNGSTNGPFVYTGFRPAFVLIKPSSAVDSWQIEDAARSPFNVVNDQLFPNVSDAEQVNAVTRQTDFLSNGFKLRETNAGVNGSGTTYIYMAFAENPVKFSLAR
jgi:hypothetical protein